MGRRTWAVLAAFVWALSFGWPARAGEAPVIAAASDLQFALSEIAQQFERQTGHRLRLSYGSSGNFYHQILQGGPFQLFLSADEDYVLRLAAQGRTEDRGTLYAVGRIVLFVPKGSPLEPDGRLEDLARALDEGRLRRFAIANPEHAPYGRAAEAALRRRGLWEKIAPRLVLGENVSQAAQFAASGSAQGSIIAYSLALSPKLQGLGRFALIPEDWHPPLRQRMVLVRGAGEVARLFYRYLQSSDAREVFRRYGFVLPAEGG